MREKCKAIIIGGSWGGLHAVTQVLEALPENYSLPVILVLHRGRNYISELEAILQKKVQLKVKEVEEKDKIMPGYVYVAPANYHLLIEEDHTFSLDVSGPVHYSRPSIDVAFESAAEVYKNRLTGIILTGANQDGAAGIKAVVAHKGTAIVQDPLEAESSIMPKAAIETATVNYVMRLKEMKTFLLQLHLSNLTA